jgi:hypothetical protein
VLIALLFMKGRQRPVPADTTDVVELAGRR